MKELAVLPHKADGPGQVSSLTSTPNHTDNTYMGLIFTLKVTFEWPLDIGIGKRGWALRYVTVRQMIAQHDRRQSGILPIIIMRFLQEEKTGVILNSIYQLQAKI